MTSLSLTPGQRRDLSLRPYQSGDYHGVAHLMRSTLLLGEPLHGRGLDCYIEACLAPYLEMTIPDVAHAVVLTNGSGDIVAYALVCTHPAAGETAVRRASLRLITKVARAWVRGDIDPTVKRFYRSRLRDLTGLIRGSRDRKLLPHAHLNVATGLRSGSAALMLRDFIDHTVSTAGSNCWMGEVNAITGQRASALTRLGFEVIERVPNHTLSRCIGKPVERLTLRRQLRGES